MKQMQLDVVHVVDVVDVDEVDKVDVDEVDKVDVDRSRCQSRCR